MNVANLTIISKAHCLVLMGVVVTFIVALVSLKFQLIAIPFAIYCVLVMTRAIQSKAITSVIYIVLALVPVVNILALISLNIKATALLKGGGIKAGFFCVSNSNSPVKLVC